MGISKVPLESHLNVIDEAVDHGIEFTVLQKLNNLEEKHKYSAKVKFLKAKAYLGIGKKENNSAERICYFESAKECIKNALKLKPANEDYSGLKEKITEYIYMEKGDIKSNV